jgi:hypothetical protein
MDEPMISRETIRERARKAHAQGKGRNDHDMNPWVEAVKTWQEEWDRCEAAKQPMPEAA